MNVPVKLGDKIYVIDRFTPHKPVTKYTVHHIRTSDDNYAVSYSNKIKDYDISELFYKSGYNKFWFTDRELAEKVYREIIGNN